MVAAQLAERSLPIARGPLFEAIPWQNFILNIILHIKEKRGRDVANIKVIINFGLWRKNKPKYRTYAYRYLSWHVLLWLI